MAKTISLINMKGGVGKSTLAVNLAWQFAAYVKWMKKVLVVDLDPQFNASQYLIGVDKYARDISAANKATVWDVFEQRTRTPGHVPKRVAATDAIINVVSYQGGSKIDLLPSRLELAWSLKQPAEKEWLLQKFLAKVRNDYDLIIIDCAPTESLLTTAAYLASDFILVPVKPEFLSTLGLPLLARSMQEFHEHYDQHELEVAGIVFNHASDYAPEERTSKNQVRAVAAQYEWHVFDSEVRFSRSYPKGAREGRPIFRTSNAHHKQKTAFHEFAQSLAEKIDL
jgi:chromosome partitioning protein